MLIAVFGAVAEGRFQLESRVHVRNRFLSIADGQPYQIESARDSNGLVHARIGRTMRVRDLARHMIVTSSNLATNLLVDLVGKFPAQARRLRLSMAYELHWDRMALFERADPAATRLLEVPPDGADLHWRGFSRMADLPLTQPFTPVYDRTAPTPVFDLLPSGWCTRYGPVLELVAEEDNALALVNAGDELTLSFPAAGLPALPPGEVRDFFLQATGWDKDSDFHVRTGTTVEPLPWRGLSDQEYGLQPRPALTNDTWIQRYNTRWVGPRFLVRKR